MTAKKEPKSESGLDTRMNDAVFEVGSSKKTPKKEKVIPKWNTMK